MTLLTASDLQQAYGHVALLEHADFSLAAGERVGLVGRNGTGKSTLLRILAGLQVPDGGQVQVKSGLARVYVAQTPDWREDETVFDCASHGLAEVKRLHERLTHAHLPADELAAVQARLDERNGWNWEQRVREALQRLNLPPGARLKDLSGGVKKRVALAQALVAQPDVLLLDEPTNHLDLPSIQWLEEWLQRFCGSVVVVSHDRAFLDAVSSRIVELDRGRLLSFAGGFTRYLQLKEEQLEQEAAVRAKADKLLAQEEAWIRKGVEARRTRAQARVARLQALRQAREQRRELMGQVRLDVDRGVSSGRVVAQLDGVSKWFETERGRQHVVRGLSATVLRGDKLALIGPNGAGKTTLLRLILGQLQPDEGQVRRGSRLSVAYFDQLKAQIDLDATLEDFISPGSEWIDIGSRRTHVRSYLADFLFAPERARSPVRTLSGGERSRLLLARLFARPANVLVLDEPTNDLDIDTLELLEDLLLRYEGTVLLVSHDRQFVNHVATGILAFEDDGRWRMYEGNVEDWILQSSRVREHHLAPAASPSPADPLPTPKPSARQRPAPPSAAGPRSATQRKLSYKEQRELDSLPARIQALETEQADIDARLADGGLFVRDAALAAALCERRAQLEDELLAAMVRWDELSDRAAAAAPASATGAVP